MTENKGIEPLNPQGPGHHRAAPASNLRRRRKRLLGECTIVRGLERPKRVLEANRQARVGLSVLPGTNECDRPCLA